MAVLTIENTGVEHLYPDGVPIIETSVVVSDILADIARTTSLAVLADPYFSDKSQNQKVFSELHGEGDRITMDFLERGAVDLLPIFASKQRWITADSGVDKMDFNVGDAITYRWLNLDTRLDEFKLNYTPQTLVNIRIDTNVTNHVEKYIYDALVDYVMKELYRAIGYDKKYVDYLRSYENNRRQAAYWIKIDTSSQRQHTNAGV